MFSQCRVRIGFESQLRPLNGMHLALQIEIRLSAECFNRFALKISRESQNFIEDPYEFWHGRHISGSSYID